MERIEMIGIIVLIVGSTIVVTIMGLLWKMWKGWIEPNGVKKVENNKRKRKGGKRDGYKVHK